MKAKLDSFERQIERSADSYRPVSKKERRKIETLLGKIRKTRSVNIRIAEHVLEEVKRRSQREGLPYQTLISSILHKYVTDRLIDEDAIRKSLRLLQR
jgi:predicted DNA binding CopG/RHH family protein